MNYIVFTIMEGRCWRTLFICDGLVTAITHTYFKLKAQEGNGGRLGAALPTNRFATFSAVMLSEADLFAVPHLFEVPEERLVTLLAGVTVQPFWSLLTLYIHVPDHNATVSTAGDELLGVVRVGNGLDLVMMSLKF